MDISQVVLEKMKEHNQKDCLQNFEYTCLDATYMPFRDGVFDMVIDKGTYAALACGDDKVMIGKLTKEMYRVTRKGGYTIIITNGTPEKRLNDL